MLTQTIPNQTASAGTRSRTLDLGNYFQVDGITGQVVCLRAKNGDGQENPIYLELFDRISPTAPAAARATPATVSNFLSYVDSGAYNGSILHRSVKSFVLQGGGYSKPDKPSDQGGIPTPIAAQPPVVNEPGNTNVRGTVAMAKLGGDPNSATNQFFWNLADNSANLDNQNGGFTVFGQVLGNGMKVVDALASAPVFNVGGAFTQLPLQGISPGAVAIQPTNYLAITKAERSAEATYQVNVRGKGVTAAVSPTGQLTLSWGRLKRPAKVTVTATSVADPADVASSTFSVVPGASSALRAVAAPAFSTEFNPLACLTPPMA